MEETRRGTAELAAAAAFAGLLALPGLGKAFHADEPFFLAIARQVAGQPLAPTAFEFNWFGSLVPMSELATVPLAVPYLLAPAWALSGGREWAVRLWALPFELAAAGFLFLLAGRFLRRPLLPVLIILASPGYFLNVGSLMAEKWVAAFGFAALWCLVRGVDEREERLWWASAGLASLAMLSKYSAVFLLGPAAWYAWRRGTRPGRLAAWLCAAVAPVVLYFCWGFLFDPGRVRAVLEITSHGPVLSLAEAAHKLRALLAFASGCCPVLLAWPVILAWPLSLKQPGRGRMLAAAGLAGAGLFLPFLDLGPTAWFDRGLGSLLAAGTCLAAACLAGGGGQTEGRDLWLPWLAAAAFLQLFAYWSVAARFTLFLCAPMALALAGRLEASLEEGGLRRLHAAGLAATLLLTLGLARVDRLYADSQKDFSRQAAGLAAASGKRLWFTGHWGFQHYMEAAGAEALDLSRGGWEQVRPGDIAAVPEVNSNIIKPGKPVYADMRTVAVESWIPLRLMSPAGSTRQAGFHSSAFGFLPWTPGLEPVEKFALIEPL